MKTPATAFIITPAQIKTQDEIFDKTVNIGKKQRAMRRLAQEDRRFEGEGQMGQNSGKFLTFAGKIREKTSLILDKKRVAKVLDLRLWPHAFRFRPFYRTIIYFSG